MIAWIMLMLWRTFLRSTVGFLLLLPLLLFLLLLQQITMMSGIQSSDCGMIRRSSGRRAMEITSSGLLIAFGLS